MGTSSNVVACIAAVILNGAPRLDTSPCSACFGLDGSSSARARGMAPWRSAGLTMIGDRSRTTTCTTGRHQDRCVNQSLVRACARPRPERDMPPLRYLHAPGPTSTVTKSPSTQRVFAAALASFAYFFGFGTSSRVTRSRPFFDCEVAVHTTIMRSTGALPFSPTNLTRVVNSRMCPWMTYFLNHGAVGHSGNNATTTPLPV